MSFFAPIAGIFSSPASISISSSEILISDIIVARENLIKTSPGYASITESTSLAAHNALLNMTSEAIQIFNVAFLNDKAGLVRGDDSIENTLVSSSGFDVQNLFQEQQQQSVLNNERANEYAIELEEARKKLEKEILDMAEKLKKTAAGSVSFEQMAETLTRKMNVLTKINDALNAQKHQIKLKI